MVQVRKFKYDVIGLTEALRRHPMNVVCDTEEEQFLGTCDSRGVGVLVNTNMAVNIDSFEQLTTRIGRLRMRGYEEEVEPFYMDLEKFYKEDQTFYKVIIGNFNAKIGARRTPRELHIESYGL
ncbi:hypothetical protein RB195_014106 [Necator americanus]|uniref:Uncharacterized protein n=1 Tax=Necator americanus TaxID=51031 RepID=A0ABR1DYL5_NECAM